MAVKSILLVEPYYGGSHKRFLDGLVDNVDAEFSLLSLPPRKWKMRMQLAAPYFIDRLQQMPADECFFDAVIFSTFIDVAVFRAMTPSVPGWNEGCRYLTFFHENQFCYPSYLDKRSNHQFTSINFTTALASDQIGFNSEFNRRSFLSACRSYLAKAADIDIVHIIGDVERKSCVLYPGVEFRGIDAAGRSNNGERTKLIVWNHRWEHDKNPEEFFEALYRLQDDGIEFRLSALGESFINRPACFDEARARLRERIVHWGYVDEREDYYRRISEGDIVVSTALHEFYGMSVIEAVRAGCRPVLPRRLSYPELFPDEFLYDKGDLGDHLGFQLRAQATFTRIKGRELTAPYSWESRKKDFQNWLD